jgi:gamma-glutamyltranspeptidase/glutathione hydrolase
MALSAAAMVSSTFFMLLVGVYLITSIAKLSGAWTPPCVPLASPGLGQTYRTHGQGKLGAVASESALCSGFGIEMLKQGGNAADAVSQYDIFRD